MSCQLCVCECDLRAAGHAVNTQETPLVPAGPGLWPCCSCLGVFVCVCGVCRDVIPHHTIHTWHVCGREQVCVLRQLSVYGVPWRQGAERRVSCDLDDR